MGWEALGGATDAIRTPNMEEKDLARAIKFPKTHRAVTFSLFYPLSMGNEDVRIIGPSCLNRSPSAAAIFRNFRINSTRC